MSTYTNFFIRVNDIFVPIGSWSRNSILGSEFITRGPWRKVRPITSNELMELIREFEKKQDSFNEKISELERKRDYVVDKCNSVDEKIEATERYNEEIRDYKIEIEEYEYAINTLSVYIEIIEEITFSVKDALPFKADDKKYMYYGVEIECPTLEDIVE